MSLRIDLFVVLRQTVSMLSQVAKFSRFSHRLFLEVIRNPNRVISEIKDIPLESCVKFGWLCFLIATIATSGFQSLLAGQVLDELTRNPLAYGEIEKILGTANAASMGDFVISLEIAQLSSLAHLLLSPLTAWFFLYLLSGALFVLAKMWSLGKTVQDNYEHVIKIVSVGQAPLLFCLIPVIGPIVGNLWSVWFIARSIANLFQLNRFTGLSIVACSFLLLFSVWNSTVSLLATAYYQRDTPAVVNISEHPLEVVNIMPRGFKDKG